MMKLVGCLLLVTPIEGLSSFLQRFRKVTPALGTSYKTSTDACCACFKRKYSWPENAGLSATFAAEKTCGTCYVADRYGIDFQSETVFSIPASPSTSTGETVQQGGKKPDCRNLCDINGCEMSFRENGKVVDQNFEGEGACDKLIAHPLFTKEWKAKEGIDDVCDPNSWFGSYVCPSACKCPGCGPDQAYDVTKSKVEDVHEWNWNCAEGDAPLDNGAWLSGAVAGEPSVRPPYTMCNEDPGFFCGAEMGPGLKKDAGNVAPAKVDDASATENSVATKTLPNVKFDFVQVSPSNVITFDFVN